MKESLLQKNPKSKIIQNGYINIYSQLNDKEKRQLGYKLKYKDLHPEWDETMVYLARMFAIYSAANSVVLDAGCGNGNYLIDENRRSISWAVGVDADERSFEKNICLDELIVSDLENLPFEKNTFDSVTSLWVLEHLQNPEKVFREIKRVLKPGGIFFFATPNKKFMPLWGVSLLNFFGVNSWLNQRLFGRYEKDIFKTYYRANTISQIKTLSRGLFDVVEMKYNYDPSYTSFNSFTFDLSNTLYKIFAKSDFHLFSPHIVGILKKGQS